MEIQLPVPKVKSRDLNVAAQTQALDHGLHPVIARVIAGRIKGEPSHFKDWLSPRLAHLDSPYSLADINKAVDRIVQAMDAQEVIGLETDHDCDGQTSQAVLFSAFVDYFKYPKEKLRLYIGHRLEEGYGLSDRLVARILEDPNRPSLIITADNGSTDEAGIARLKAHGIETIVTDHHQIPKEGIPKSAIAVINPTREDCQYPDPLIAGCMVAWLLMAATMARLKTLNKVAPSAPSVQGLLDYVAVGTVADCVSIARSHNNRTLIRYGLSLIQKQVRPCWQAAKPYLSTIANSEDLGFKIGPMLNSDGRLSSADNSVGFLLSQTKVQAQELIDYLQLQNQKRKDIQKNITQAAMKVASEQLSHDVWGLCIYLKEGHSGVHGISASRVKDAFGRPTIIFSPKLNHPNQITGSGRSIEGLNLREVLQRVYEQDPSKILKFGGHHGAAGITLEKVHLEWFCQAFDHNVKQALNFIKPGPVLYIDGKLPLEGMNVPFIEEMERVLHPFGREFESPCFEAVCQVHHILPLGKDKIHLRLVLGLEEQGQRFQFQAIWFNALTHREAPLNFSVGQWVNVIYSPKVNEFRGEKSFNPQISAVFPIEQVE